MNFGRNCGITQMRLDLSDEEAVTLTMLTMIGLTAFDTESQLTEQIKRRFEEKFKVEISQETILNTMTKVKCLIATGDEDVIME